MGAGDKIVNDFPTANRGHEQVTGLAPRLFKVRRASGRLYRGLHAYSADIQHNIAALYAYSYCTKIDRAAPLSNELALRDGSCRSLCFSPSPITNLTLNVERLFLVSTF